MGAFIQQVSNTAQNLNHVYGFGAYQTWAVGDNGTIVYWNGQRWTQQSSGTTSKLLKVWGASAASVWIVGLNGTLLNSTNGGQTWTQVNSLGAANIALHASGSGDFTAIWGPSATSFSVAVTGVLVPSGAVYGEIWLTQDGGNTWVRKGLTQDTERHMWGDGANNDLVVAVGFRSPTATLAKIGLWTGIGTWGGTTEAAPNVDSFGCWASLATLQAYTCGFGQTGATSIGTISNWILGPTGPNRNFQYRALEQVPTAAQYSALHGADLVNLYAAGVNQASGPILAQVATIGTTASQGSWLGVTLPATLPIAGGLNGVFADPSGYAVTVGNKGAIAAKSGPSLSLISAAAVATNTVRVVLAAAPLAVSPVGVGDALNPATWTVQRVDTGQQLDVMAVTQVSPTVFNLVLFGRFAGAQVLYQVSTSLLLDPYGNAIIVSAPGQISDVLSAPVVKSVGLASPVVQAYPIWVPPDVTSIDVWVSNRDCLAGLFGGPVAGCQVAVGTPNAALTGWASTPQIVSGVALAGDNTATLVPGFSVTRNAAGYIMVGWLIPASGGSFVDQENNNGWGLGGNSPDLVGLTGVTQRTISAGIALFGFMAVRYSTSQPRLVSFGDSITRGLLSTYPTTPEHTVGVRGSLYAAGSAGCGSLSAATVAGGGRPFDFDVVSLSGNVALLRLGTNDVIAGVAPMTLSGNLAQIMTTMRSLGARKVGIATILPSSSYSGAQNTVLATINASILSLALGNDFAVDLYTAVKDPSANQIYPPWAADAFHPNPLGQGQLRAFFPGVLP